MHSCARMYVLDCIDSQCVLPVTSGCYKNQLLQYCYHCVTALEKGHVFTFTTSNLVTTSHNFKNNHEEFVATDHVTWPRLLRLAHPSEPFIVAYLCKLGVVVGAEMNSDAANNAIDATAESKSLPFDSMQRAEKCHLCVSITLQPSLRPC